MVLYNLRTQQAIRELDRITRQYQIVQEGSRKTSFSPVRHKVFVSYHAADAIEVLEFIQSNTDVFIPRAIGMEEDGSDIIDSTNQDYIRQTIRSRHLKDSTVTLVAIGKCTWARKYVDWEIYTSLRSDPTPHGLLGMQLPSISGERLHIPERLSLNLGDSYRLGYADYYPYPSSQSELRTWIEQAFAKRTSQPDLLELGGPLKKRNSSCV